MTRKGPKKGPTKIPQKRAKKKDQKKGQKKDQKEQKYPGIFTGRTPGALFKGPLRLRARLGSPRRATRRRRRAPRTPPAGGSEPARMRPALEVGVPSVKPKRDPGGL